MYSPLYSQFSLPPLESTLILQTKYDGFGGRCSLKTAGGKLVRSSKLMVAGSTLPIFCCSLLKLHEGILWNTINTVEPITVNLVDVFRSFSAFLVTCSWGAFAFFVCCLSEQFLLWYAILERVSLNFLYSSIAPRGWWVWCRSTGFPGFLPHGCLRHGLTPFLIVCTSSIDLCMFSLICH